MDYQFFQLLTDRIDRARGDGRARLIELRDKLLELTREIDQQMEKRRIAARQQLDETLKHLMSPKPCNKIFKRWMITSYRS